VCTGDRRVVSPRPEAKVLLDYCLTSEKGGIFTIAIEKKLSSDDIVTLGSDPAFDQIVRKSVLEEC